MTKISVVINTYNEEKYIKQAIESVKWADEILVCDMHSDDDTAIVAKKAGAKVIFHKHMPFVEPARNFAISKTSYDWVLVMDPDEEIPETLAKKLQEVANQESVTTFFELPRKNLIFGKWVKASMWWPDYNIRFFKKETVSWGDKIHIKPKTTGQGIQLPAEERFAIIHHHYDSISQFLHRLDRYTSIQAKELKQAGEEFDWRDLFTKPLSEFLSRFFANRGFDDGVHGLALSLLQAFSFLIVYLKLWEMREFKQQDLKFDEVKKEAQKAGEQISYWFKYGNLSKNPLKRALQKVKNEILSS